MNKYETPKIEICVFATEDIITTSGFNENEGPMDTGPNSLGLYEE